MLDLVNFETVDELSMPSTPLVAMSASLFKHDYVLRLGDLFYSCVDSRILDLRPAKSCVVLCANKENVANADLRTNFLVQVFDHYPVIF